MSKEWINKVDRIVCLNLTIREDRLLEFAKQADEYEIPFDRISSIHDRQQGARGLRDTMVKLFNEEIEKGTKNLLVFEDDAVFLEEPFWFHETMNKVIDQLPENFHMCYLGGQASHRFSHFHSANLLPVTMYFATHAVIYSLQGMKEIISRQDFHTDEGYPIDNWIVKEIQPMGNCYTCHPILCSQRPGHSDIGHNFIDWFSFIVPRHAQKIAEMGGAR